MISLSMEACLMSSDTGRLVHSIQLAVQYTVDSSFRFLDQ